VDSLPAFVVNSAYYSLSNDSTQPNFTAVREWHFIVKCFINTLSLLYFFVQLDLFFGSLLQRLRIIPLAKCDRPYQLPSP